MGKNTQHNTRKQTLKQPEDRNYEAKGAHEAKQAHETPKRQKQGAKHENEMKAMVRLLWPREKRSHRWTADRQPTKTRMQRRSHQKHGNCRTKLVHDGEHASTRQPSQTRQQTDSIRNTESRTTHRKNRSRQAIPAEATETKERI